MAAVQVVSRYRWVILALTVLAQVNGAFAAMVLAPLAPLFQPELGLSKAQVGLFSVATFAGAWCVLLVAGSLTDRFGIRSVMSVGQLVTGALLLSMASAGSLFQAAAVMFLTGVARSMIFPGCSKAILDWFPRAGRATAMSLKQTGTPLAGIVTAAALPALGLALGWRFAIAATGLVVVAGGIVTALLYRDPDGSQQTLLDRAGPGSVLRSVIRNRMVWTLGAMALLFGTVQQTLITFLAL